MGSNPTLSARRAPLRWNFLVFSQTDPEKLRVRVAELEKLHRLLRLLTGAQAPENPPRLRICIVEGTGGLREVGDVSSRGLDLPHD